MLIKAVSTGVVLAGLSWAMVYFGAEGVDALEADSRAEVSVADTELAGAAQPVLEAMDDEAKAKKILLKEKRAARVKAKAEARAQAKAEAQAAKAEEQVAASENTAMVSQEADQEVDTPPAKKSKEQPKRKWLDQYLKSSKSKKIDDLPEEKSKTLDKHEGKAGLKHAKGTSKAAGEMDEDAAEDKPRSNKKMVKKKIVIKIDDDETATWTSGDELMGEDFDLEMIEQLMLDHRASKPDVRVLGLGDKAAKHKKPGKKMKRVFDYAPVLEEAKKLQVIDMRNIAMFEIIDYAVDRGDFVQAADILQELSDPELRDTARAKIGVGLAKCGDSEAAFAVLDEMEIDELTASMRLEIIAALMATRAERAAAPRHR